MEKIQAVGNSNMIDAGDKTYSITVREKGYCISHVYCGLTYSQVNKLRRDYENNPTDWDSCIVRHGQLVIYATED